MRERPTPIVLLVYEDDERAAAFEAASGASRFMKDLVLLKGVSALGDYLDRCYAVAPAAPAPCPNLILFDLASSLDHARAALARLKRDDLFRPIPVVVLARTPGARDYLDTYDLGVNAFVDASDDPDEIARTLQIIENFWLDVVTLPHAEKPVRVV